MKKVFTHENRLIVFNMKNVLQDHHIECIVKNEFASGGVGDLSPFETWPEIWVSETLSTQPSAVNWICTECGESNGSNFTICWNCNENVPER